MENHRPGLRTGCQLTSLPKELLQVVLDVPFKYELRRTCKALSNALADSCSSILLQRAQLLRRGPQQEVEDAFKAFPNAHRVVLNFKPKPTRGPAGCHGDVAMPELLKHSLGAMCGRRITSLALLHLPCEAPAPAALAAHASSLEELELSDDMYPAALEQGAVNVLARSRDAVARGDAMVELALSLPRLRRLSLSSAAFSAQRIRALGALTRLESLSIAGSMVCQGGAAQAAATHRALLAALPSLRQLRLPMALTSCESFSSFLDDDEEGGELFEGAEEDEDRLGNTAGGGAVSGGAAGGTAAGRSGSSAWSQRLLFGIRMGPLTTAPRATLFGAGGSGASAAAAHEECMMAAGSGVGSQQLKRRRESATATASFVFPPDLQDLTIPLCALNRPIFEAVCAEYASGSAEASPLEGRDARQFGASRRTSGAAGNGGVLSCRRVLSFPQLPSTDVDPRAPGGLCSTGLLSVWGSASAGGSFQTSGWSENASAPAPGAQPSSSAIHAAGHRCAGAPTGGGRLRSLHIPALGGYSHWEGSFLSSPHDFERLAGLRSLEVLHVSLELSAMRQTRENMRACFQHLRAMGELAELRISEAQQPACFTVRKRSHSTRGPDAFRPSSMTPCLDDRSLEQLQRQWPRLRCLQFFGETVVRGPDGSLQAPAGLAGVGLLPTACAFCREPHVLVATAPRSGGRGL